MSFSRTILFAAASLTAATLGACNSDKENEPEDHDPVSVTFTVDGVAAGATLQLHAGSTPVVRATFFNAEGESLDDVEGEHFSLLEFDPTTLATAAFETDHHFSHDVTVTAAAGATGSVIAHFGHDEEADEHTLDPVPVEIIP